MYRIYDCIVHVMFCIESSWQSNMGVVGLSVVHRCIIVISFSYNYQLFGHLTVVFNYELLNSIHQISSNLKLCILTKLIVIKYLKKKYFFNLISMYCTGTKPNLISNPKLPGISGL